MKAACLNEKIISKRIDVEKNRKGNDLNYVIHRIKYERKLISEM